MRFKRLTLFLVLSLFLAGASQAETRGLCRSKYQFPGECTACHIPPTGQVGYPVPPDIRIYGDTAHIYIEHMDFQRLREKIHALKPFPIKKIVFDLFSYGGAVFEAMAMVGLIEEQARSGKIIEVRARGLIASAGLLILISGTEGHRYIERNSLIMFHEISSFKFMAIERPSDKEEEAQVFRRIQDKINSYIVSRSKITKEELSQRIKKREMWLDAHEAVKFGFADEIL